MTTVTTPEKPVESPATTPTAPDPRLAPSDTFVHRHIGPGDAEIAQMLALLGYDSLDVLADAVVPESIRLRQPLNLGAPRGEFELLEELKTIADKNKVLRSCIGQGYYDCITPPVILRNILENPGWYTQYTPYQAEIAQGRLEALLNFQTMVADLTGLPMANASLLDEPTAAAEAMAMCYAIARHKRNVFFVSDDCHPQTINVCRTRAESMGIELIVGGCDMLISDGGTGIGGTGVGGTGVGGTGVGGTGVSPVIQGESDENVGRDGRPTGQGVQIERLCGVLVQYPNTYGAIHDPQQLRQLADRVHEAGAQLVAATDLLALTLIKPPGEWGADIAVGSAQRFGVPLGGGGPHAAFMATREEHVRRMPGRIVGVSKDAHGHPAYRLAIQTREQHIKRERATSNICTAQVLLAIIASMYAVYHGPKGLRRIAERVRRLTAIAAEGFRRVFEDAGAPASVFDADTFDTFTIEMASRECVETSLSRGQELGVNLRDFGDNRVGISLDETTTMDDVRTLWRIADVAFDDAEEAAIIDAADRVFDQSAIGNRQSPILTHPVFNTYHSETEMLRYLHRLQSRDLSLTHSMISLGSCTMKLNGTSEMIPVTWPQFARMHPYAPADQQQGYAKLCDDLEKWLCEITGFAAVSLQPNAGSQGEYAGLLAIRAYHASRGEAHRTVCLIPTSAHGTNPASAVIAGFEVVTVACDKHGNIDAGDLAAKARQHADKLGALMITYPSTHGVFEPNVRQIIDIVHEHGGQVYMDGANMNAQVGLTSPAAIGADVCHLNLHKTFCIPHGGGGPGMGPIGVAEHLVAFLPGDPLDRSDGATKRQSDEGVGPVSAARWGSASILPISWVYIALMGAQGLKKATQVAILNANYMAKRLGEHYPVLYSARNGTVAHEFIIDCRQLKQSAGVEIDDIAKRLMDYGFHAPTMSFPVPGTLMIEPTESESKSELDRLCDALIAIRQEVRAIEQGRADRQDNALKHAPHTAAAVSADSWPHAYSRQSAAYPAPWVREHKFWPHVGRIDNPYGDRNLFCTCVPVEDAGGA